MKLAIPVTVAMATTRTDMLEQPEKTRSKKTTKQRLRSPEAAGQSLARILNLIRSGQAQTRQEIERTSELGRAIVTDRLTILSDLNLVDESGLGVATGGRAPRLVRFNPAAGHCLVATLNHSALGVAIADLSGALLTEHHEELDPYASPDEIIGHLTALFDWLLDRDAQRRSIWSIGLSVPGPVQTRRATYFCEETPPMSPAWDGSGLVEHLLARYRAPVWMRSSVEAMALGEAQAGDAKSDDTILFLNIGTRIGAGLVTGGTLYDGAWGVSGLIGHTPIDTDEGSGSLEAMAGGAMIARLGERAAEIEQSSPLAGLRARQGQISALDVCQVAQNGDHTAMEILSRSGRLIGQAVAAAANMLNPSRIVISGSIAQGNDILLAAVREMVYRQAHPLISRDLSIEASPLGSSAGLVGAAAVAVGGLFEPTYLKHWIITGHPSQEPGFDKVLAAAQCHRNAQVRG